MDANTPRIGVTILGSTGSIGVNTLDVLSRHTDRFRVVALSANTDVERLTEQCVEFRPKYVAMADATAARALEQRIHERALPIQVLVGSEGLEHISSLDEVDYVMAAIVGSAGLLPTLAAAYAGKRILLANKEALVMSGRILMDAVRANGATLLPIDSEHNAIFQCMPSNYQKGLDQIGVRRILLTASGGPFRDTPLEALASVTPEQACAHPNWAMGRKISVDSATMMNKGLEVIEACWLFDTAPDRIQVVVHPQSVVHSMVEYVDGSVLAQMGNPDMRTPIANALGWPGRIESGVDGLDVLNMHGLEFRRPDVERFPCLRLAYQAMEKGGTATSVLNAANEVAVQRFLDGDLAFTEIPRVIGKTLATVPIGAADSLAAIQAADTQAREFASRIMGVASVEDHH